MKTLNPPPKIEKIKQLELKKSQLFTKNNFNLNQKLVTRLILKELIILRKFDCEKYAGIQERLRFHQYQDHQNSVEFLQSAYAVTHVIEKINRLDQDKVKYYIGEGFCRIIVEMTTIANDFRMKHGSLVT